VSVDTSIGPVPVVADGELTLESIVDHAARFVTTE
jgi:hypothetical protein